MYDCVQYVHSCDYSRQWTWLDFSRRDEVDVTPRSHLLQIKRASLRTHVIALRISNHMGTIARDESSRQDPLRSGQYPIARVISNGDNFYSSYYRYVYMPNVFTTQRLITCCRKKPQIRDNRAVIERFLIKLYAYIELEKKIAYIYI